MNIYLLQVVAKWFHILLISVISLYGGNSFDLKVNNLNNNKNLNVVNTVIPYKEIIKYNHKLPSNVSNMLVEGVDGIVYEENNEIVNVIREKVDQVVEKGTGPIGNYYGKMTVYGPDCATCDGRGVLYCPTIEGKWHSLNTDGIYYEDKDFGQVRIIAADHRQFPCGTIIKINNSDFKDLMAIVLDTGSGMRNAYDNNWLLIDLAFATEKNIGIGTNSNTNFSVQRWGW
ncbi:MAG: hypothetical protein PHO63_04605 [Bacilli bacterium]|nr:hypothetical protein [Bacilli bacterium]MDD4809077.1 hypothetical protein [Bacilli bacterium]